MISLRTFIVIVALIDLALWAIWVYLIFWA